jgi:hypothetical protein
MMMYKRMIFICLMLMFSSSAESSWESAFGNSMRGDNSGTLTANKSRVTSFDLSESAWIKRFRAYIQPGTDNQKAKVVVYADSGGLPGNLIIASNEYTIVGGSGSGWSVFTLNEPLLFAPGKYWMGLLTDVAIQPSRYNFFVTTRSRVVTSDQYADGPNPVFGKPESILNGTMSIYAIYQIDTPCFVNATCTAHATWDGNAPTDLVTGYKIYYGKTSRSAPGFVAYDKTVDAGNVTNVDIPGFDRNDYYFSAKAYNAIGESPYSDEVVVRADYWVERMMSATTKAESSRMSLSVLHN